MPINYTVRADVIDIRKDEPQPTDEFLVDTNVWCWLAYTRIAMASRPPTQARVSAYSGYVNQVLTNGAQLRRCGLSLAEMIHLIEKTEREIYCHTAGVPSLQTKEFRHNLPAERIKVFAEVQAAWTQIKAMASCLDLTVDEATINAALVRFQTEPVDGYDLFLLEAAAASRITKIITDDGDYCCVPGIQMFTGNQGALAAAQAQGKLVVR